MNDSESVVMVTPTSQGRIIGFRHKVKVKIVDGEPTEPLPSMVSIHDGEGVKLGTLELPDEQAELDFINGILPVKFRNVDPSEDISTLNQWQVKWRPAKEEDLSVTRHPSQSRFEKRKPRGGGSFDELVEVVEKVPCEWTGLREGDRLAMVLGGSGDYFAFAAAVHLHKIGGEVFRIPSFELKALRGNGDKDDDAELLANSLLIEPGKFYPTLVRDRLIIQVRELYRIRMDIMRDRMACAARLRQRAIGMIFCTSNGGFPQGGIEKEFATLKANDPALTAIQVAEEKILKQMTEAVEATEVWQKLFEDLPGVGPGIAARLITAIGDIRRFSTDAKLKRYLGVHVNSDGTFPRRRSGQVANWSGDGRQALFLLADQFVKKPDSVWGKKLNSYKKALRLKHPQVVVKVKDPELAKLFPDGFAPIGLPPQKAKKGVYEVVHPQTGETIKISGPMKWNDGHIHKTAIWRTVTRFTQWLHREWMKLENAHKAS